MHGDPLLHPSALDSLRGELFPLATLVTPNLDEVRLLVDIEVDRRLHPSVRRPGLCTHSARSGRWSRAGTCASSSHSPDLLFDGTDFYEFDADPHRHRQRPRRR